MVERGDGCVAATCDADGVILVDEEGATRVPAFDVDLVDTTGCGDAYRAGLLYGIAHGWDWQAIGNLASVMGSLKIASRGGQNHRVERAEVAERYRSAFGERPW